MKSSVGTNPPRPDGEAKVTGRALYVDDLVVEGMWFGATVRSPHPAARILEIDARAALAQDPEAVVLTAAELPGPNVVKLIEEDWPLLAAERVNHVAEPVALVAAPTRERARAAARRVEVSYAVLPAVLDLDAALDGDPVVLAHCGTRHGDLRAGFDAADVIVEGLYETAHQEHVYIEPQGMLAVPGSDGELEVVGSLQCPYYLQHALEHLFPGTRIRVRQATTGGGFGGKEDYPDMIGAHAALLALRTKKPVKLVYERHEDMVATTKRHPSRIAVKSGVDAEGRLTALEIDLLLDGGAYATLSSVVLSRAVLHAAGPYACPHVAVSGRVLATNTATNGAFRGFGAPQAQYAIERHMDRVARTLGLDPLTLRERNAYRVGDVTPTGQVLEESVSALDCLREAEERTNFRARWKACEAARSGAENGGAPLQGLGLSLIWHGAGFTGNGERLMRSPVALRLGEAGGVEVLVSSTDFGQGTSIVLSQIVADAVGLGTEQVRVAEADTACVPDSGPTVASRTVMIVGGALERAGRRLAAELCAFAAAEAGQASDAVHIDEGAFVDASGGHLASFDELARRHRERHGALEIVERFEPGEEDPGFDEATYRGTAYAAYGWGANVIEVEVDPDTLAVRPTRATLICDVGKAIHPVLCAGQVEGGTLQALGHGYLEEIKMADGRYLNDTLSTYVIPTTLDTPDMETVLLENPAPIGPQGAKGVGELPMDGGAAALAAAIENATGIAATRAPATPEVLLKDLLAGKTCPGALRVADFERERSEDQGASS